MCKLQVTYIGRVTIPGNRYDMIYARAQRVRIFKAKVDSLSADTADFLRSIDFLFVCIKLSLMCSVTVWTIIRFCHIPLPQGIKIALARDICVLSRCLVFFKFYAEYMVEVIYSNPRTFLLYDDSFSVVSVVVPFSFAVGDSLTALEGNLYSVSTFHFLTPSEDLPVDGSP